MEMCLDGMTVHYEEQGTGPLVVLLHGWGSNLSLFASIAHVIARKYRVVSIDFPGCGETQEPPIPWGMDEYTRFTRSFITSFGETEVILLGHSHGGRVSIRLATDSDTDFAVTKMILVDSAGIMPRRSIGHKARVGAYKLGKKFLTLDPVAKLFPEALDDLQRSMGSADYAAASPIMRASLVKVVNSDLAPLLSKVTAETLLVWGEDDASTPLSDGRTMEREIPGSGLVVLPHAGHYSFLDQAFTFQKVIESFLAIG